MKEMKLLKTKEVARRLGVSPRTVAKWLRDGELRGQKIPHEGGHIWRVREDDLQHFIDSSPTPP